jgi:hypothetical protein
MKTRYVLMVHGIAQGPVLAERDGDGMPILYETVEQAEAEVADNMIEQYCQVVEGSRSLDEVGEPDRVAAISVGDDGTRYHGYGIVLGYANLALPD